MLVSAPFESHPEFFFPPARPRRLATRDGRHVDTAEAVVTLAEIPVVRLRHGLPEALARGEASFNATVAALQESFAPPRLAIDLAARRVRCGAREVMLTPALLAWLAFWANTARQGQPLRHWREIAPAEFLDLYGRVVGLDAEAYEKAARRLAGGMEKEFFEENNAKLEATFRRELGPAAAPYLLVRAGQRPRTRRGLGLPPQAIDLST